jgi:hypothetical protein
MAAKQLHAVFSLGQHDGHLAPGEYTGLVPAAQNPSSAKHSQLWSLVALRPFPGQHAPAGHLHGTVSQPGQMVEHWLVVGSVGGGSQKPMEAKQSQTLFSAGQQDGHALPGVYTGLVPAAQKPS